MASNTDRLAELTDDLDMNQLSAVFDLLQEDHNGHAKAFNENQIDKINAVIPLVSVDFSREAIETVIDALKQSKSKMSRLGRTQVSRFMLSLTREEIVEAIEILKPFFFKHSGKFVNTLTADQKNATFVTLFPEILDSAQKSKKTAPLLLALYTVSRIGESLEILENADDSS